MVFYNYPSRLSLLLSRLPLIIFRWPSFLRRWSAKHGRETFVVRADQIPHALDPGRTWQGMATHSPEIEKMIKGGRLFVGVIGSHSGKPFLRRVRRWTPPEDAKPA